MSGVRCVRCVCWCWCWLMRVKRGIIANSARRVAAAAPTRRSGGGPSGGGRGRGEEGGASLCHYRSVFPHAPPPLLHLFSHFAFAFEARRQHELTTPTHHAHAQTLTRRPCGTGPPPAPALRLRLRSQARDREVGKLADTPPYCARRLAAFWVSGYTYTHPRAPCCDTGHARRGLTHFSPFWAAAASHKLCTN